MKIIFDNDAASDDVIGLIYMAARSDVDLLGVTVAGTGEAHGVNGANNMADVCYMLGLPNVPIAYGSKDSLENLGTPFPDFLRVEMDRIFNGKSVPKHPNPQISDDAVALMHGLLSQSEEPVTILATGPLTNIAELIQRHPEAVAQIDKIVIMGGAVDVPGNIPCLIDDSDNHVAEWNIYADPKAAEIVFQSGIPVTLVSLDATNQVPMTQAFYDALSQAKQPELQLTYRLLKDIVDIFGMEYFLEKFYLWDPLAAMVAVDANVAETTSIPIQMDLKTSDTKHVPVGTPGAAMINVATHIPQPENILPNLLETIKQFAQSRLEKVSEGGMYALQHSRQSDARRCEEGRRPDVAIS